MRADLLHVIAVVANPVRYQSRYRLYREFAARMEQAGVVFYTVEAAYGERPFEVTEANNPRHLQLRTSEEVWLKERLQNLGVKRLLPADARYIAFIDADVTFVNPNWAAETVHALQHYDVVQCFTDTLDLGPAGEIIAQGPRRSFFFQYHRLLQGDTVAFGGSGAHCAAYAHPGYTLAMTRDAYDAIGGLMDFCIVGSADFHQCMGLIGKGGESIWPGVSDGYRAAIQRWCDRSVRALRRNVGFVPGTLLHHWHGTKARRGYLNREQILVRRQFDPAVHLTVDSNDLWRLDHAGGELRDEIRFFFRNRNEDGIDV